MDRYGDWAESSSLLKVWLLGSKMWRNEVWLRPFTQYCMWQKFRQNIIVPFNFKAWKHRFVNKCLFVLLDISYTSLQTDVYVFEWNSRALTMCKHWPRYYILSAFMTYYRCLFILNSCSTGRITQWFVIVFSYIVCGSYCLKRMQVWVKMVCGFCICIYTSL